MSATEMLEAEAEGRIFLRGIRKAAEVLADEFSADDDECQVTASRCIAAFLRSLAEENGSAVSATFVAALECFADTLEGKG